MSNPLQDIEDAKSQTDLGVMLSRVYQGALDETGSAIAAFYVVAGFCYAMLKGGTDNEEGGDIS